jgi:protein arginine kinase activator
MLGCGSCYEAFADRLGPLIERTHEGAACHVGKAPVRAVFPGDAVPTSGDGGPAVRDRAGALTELRRRLRTAIAAERFEAAAQIREEIRRVSLGQADAEASGGRDA